MQKLDTRFKLQTCFALISVCTIYGNTELFLPTDLQINHQRPVAHCKRCFPFLPFTYFIHITITMEILFTTITDVPMRSSRPHYSVLIYYLNLSGHLLTRISSVRVKAQEQQNKLRKENLSKHDPTLIATEWRATTLNTAILNYSGNTDRNNANPGATGPPRTAPLRPAPAERSVTAGRAQPPRARRAAPPAGWRRQQERF